MDKYAKILVRRHFATLTQVSKSLLNGAKPLRINQHCPPGAAVKSMGAPPLLPEDTISQALPLPPRPRRPFPCIPSARCHPATTNPPCTVSPGNNQSPLHGVTRKSAADPICTRNGTHPPQTASHEIHTTPAPRRFQAAANMSGLRQEKQSAGSLQSPAPGRKAGARLPVPIPKNRFWVPSTAPGAELQRIRLLPIIKVGFCTQNQRAGRHDTARPGQEPHPAKAP